MIPPHPAACLDRAVEQWPQQVFAEYGDARVTYADFAAQCRREAERLRAAGVTRGQRVAIADGSDRFAQSVSLFALWEIRAVPCPLHGRATPEEAAAYLSCLRPAWLLECGAVHAHADAIPDLESALVIRTSGSTAGGRAVALSGEALCRSVAAANAAVPLTATDAWLLSLPLYHIGGVSILLRVLAAGACFVSADSLGDLSVSLATRSLTHLSLVSTQLRRLLARCPDGAPKGIRAVLLGGGSVDRALVREARSAGWPIRPTYGMTEYCSQIATCPPDLPDDKVGASGCMLAHVSTRIDEAGEICVRGPGLMRGYLDASGAAISALGDEGWFHTGDLGHVDDEGYLWVTGRRDAMFVSGGENIHPERIEAAVQERFGLGHAVIVPVPSAEFGSRPVLLVPDPECVPDLDAVRAGLREKLPGYMLPTAVWKLPDWATQAMKVNRPRLRTWAERRS